MMNRRNLLLVTLLLVSTVQLWAQYPTLNEPNEAAIFAGGSELLTSVQNICYVLGAMCAIIGALRTYIEILDGEEDLYSSVRNWFGSCLAFIIFPMIIRALAGF